MARKSRSLKNAAATTLPNSPPVSRSTTVNNQAPNYPALVLAGGLVAAGGVLFGWWALVQLMDKIGARDPEATAAISLVVLGSVGFVAWGVAPPVLDRVYLFWDRWCETKEVVEQARSEAVKARMLLAQNAGAIAREPHAKRRILMAVLAVMQRAYDFIDREGHNYEYQDATPWARAQLAGLKLVGENDPVSWSEAPQVKRYLTEAGMIYETNRAWKVDLEQFPDFLAVETYIRRTEAYSVSVTTGGPRLPAGPAGDYRFLEE